jgi:hypothetical protein
MLVSARLVCSDGDCAVLYEAIGWLAEIESLGCECGCGLQVLGWPEALGGDFRRDAGPMLTALD